MRDITRRDQNTWCIAIEWVQGFACTPSIDSHWHKASFTSSDNDPQISCKDLSVCVGNRADMVEITRTQDFGPACMTDKALENKAFMILNSAHKGGQVGLSRDGVYALSGTGARSLENGVSTHGRHMSGNIVWTNVSNRFRETNSEA